MFNIVKNTVRQSFPLIHQEEMIYLDSAATSQKPQRVINAITEFYAKKNANVHRGLYTLSERASVSYEEVRQQTAEFIGARSKQEVIYTKGTTESINLLATSLPEEFLREGDEIIVSTLEHHSNLLPWIECAKKVGASIKTVGLNDDHTLDITHYKALLSAKTRLVCITGMSNVTGEEIDLREIAELAHEKGAKVIVDAAQLVAHKSMDVSALNIDALTFSTHKVYGPMGLGILYVKKDFLDTLRPYQLGGGMVKEVDTEISYLEAPTCFEAGTPNVGAVTAWGETIRVIDELELTKKHAHLEQLSSRAFDILKQFKDVQIYSKKGSTIIAFAIKDVHPHDIAEIFSKHRIAIRAGHHCTKPLMKALAVNALARISVLPYNSLEDIDAIEPAMKEVIQLFKE